MPLLSRASIIHSFTIRAAHQAVRTSLLSLALTTGLTLSPWIASSSAHAQGTPDLTTLRLQKPSTLRGQFVYWFTNADRDMSTRQNLPAPGADGLLTIPIPADFRQPDALLNVLDVRRNLIARLPVKGNSPPEESAAPSVPEGPNLVQNGDFAQGVDRWTTENSGKASVVSKVVSDAGLPTGVAGKVVRLDVDAIDKEVWHAQFYEGGVDMANDTPYTLTFWARAERDRALSVISQLDEEDYHSVGLNAAVQIGAQWRKYTVAFTAAGSRPRHNKIGFLVGSMLGRVELAGIMLQRGVTARPLGPNMLQNADFTSKSDHWEFQSTPPAQATMQISAAAPPPGFTGNVLRFQIGHVGVNPWDAQLLQSDVPLEPTKIYTFSFWGRADRSHDISARTAFIEPNSPCSGLEARMSLTPEWHKYTYIFTTAEANKTLHQLGIQVGSAPGVVELAGLSLQPGAVNSAASNASAFPVLFREAFTVAYKSGLQTNEEVASAGTKAHRSHPLVGTWQSFHKDVGLTGKEYQRYRFIFDPNGSGSLQVTSLTENADAPPKSQQTESFKWQLIEGGPHVSIGSNVYTWAIEKEGKDSPKLKLTLKNYEGKTYILFRQ